MTSFVEEQARREYVDDEEVTSVIEDVGSGAAAAVDESWPPIVVHFSVVAVLAGLVVILGVLNLWVQLKKHEQKRRQAAAAASAAVSGGADAEGGPSANGGGPRSTCASCASFWRQLTRSGPGGDAVPVRKTTLKMQPNASAFV